MQLSVIIPVYNEINTVEEIIRRVENTPHDKEIIVVDDGSTDGTTQVLKELQESKPHVLVIYQEKNEGKGAAVQAAVPHITGDITIIQDADLEYSPEEYSRMIELIESGKADVVFGSRFLSPRQISPYIQFSSSRLITTFSNLLFNKNLSDLTTCFKVLRTEILKSIPLKSKNFGFDAEISGRILQKHLRIFEVPISYHSRTHEDGKKKRWTDNFSLIYWLLRTRFTTVDIGEETLFRLSSINRYYEIFFHRIKHLLGDRVLEIGSGVGNFTRFMMNRELVVATDYSENHLRTLRQRFVERRHFRIHPFDATLPPATELKDYKIDTIICMNVLEHIEDDLLALSNMLDLLAPGGRLILLVPNIKALYGSLDKGLDHFRRYSRQELIEKLQSVGFEIEETFFFNMWGVPGWFVNSRILKRKVLPRFQLYFFSVLHPLVKLEQHFKTPFGLSVIAIAKKPVTQAIPQQTVEATEKAEAVEIYS